MTDLDDELLFRARGGDSAALEALYQRHVRLALHYARHWSRPDETEDLVHDAFLRAIDPATPYRACGRFRSWFLVLLRSIGTDRSRRFRRRSLLLGRRARQGQVHSFEPVEPMDENLQRLLDSLPIVQRRTLELRVLWGLSYDEIREIEAVEPSTLRSRVFYALQKLRTGMMTQTDGTTDHAPRQPQNKLSDGGAEEPVNGSRSNRRPTDGSPRSSNRKREEDCAEQPSEEETRHA